MRIIVVGIGGVGGYFGGRLACTSHHVSFLARGEHLKAIRSSGLEVKSIYGDFTAHPEVVTDDWNELEPADLILVCTKTWQLEALGPKIARLINPGGVVLPLQNGVNSREKLIRAIPEEAVLGGLCKVISKISGPGRIHHFAFHPQIIFGAVHPESVDRARQLLPVFEAAGIDGIYSDNIELDAWRKFLFICVLSGIGALTRQEVGLMRADEGIRPLMEASAREIIQIGQAGGVPLTEADFVNTFKAIDKQDYHTTSSMQRDMMEGRPSELHDFNGFIVRQGEKFGIDVPVNRFIYSCLRPLESQARQNHPVK